MERGKVIGYVNIYPSLELRSLLDDPSYSLVNSKLIWDELDE